MKNASSSLAASNSNNASVKSATNQYQFWWCLIWYAFELVWRMDEWTNGQTLESLGDCKYMKHFSKRFWYLTIHRNIGEGTLE